MRRILFATMMVLITVRAEAAPGVGDPIYGATLEKGVTEFEARYGRLTGGSDGGEDGLVLEAEQDLSSRFSAAVLVETSHSRGEGRRVEALALEGVYTLGHIRALALDTAIYGEFKHGLHGDADAIELKALFEHRAGPFDARVNLIGEKPLRSGEATEFGYAASLDWMVAGDEVRLGLAAFGDLGTVRHFAGREEAFVGPEAKFEIERVGPGEIEIETGWLKSFGAARDVTNGQARLLVSYEARF